MELSVVTGKGKKNKDKCVLSTEKIYYFLIHTPYNHYIA